MISLSGTEAFGFTGHVAWDAHGETTKRSTVRRWDGWIMGRTPAARRCNALVRECRGFMSGLTLKVGGLSPKARPFGTSLCFRRLLPALTDARRSPSLGCSRGSFPVPLSRARQGGDWGAGREGGAQ
jgi:hypothetical protein